MYGEATDAVVLNGNVGDFFRTTAGVRQGCKYLKYLLFNVFLQKIMQKALTPENPSEDDRLATCGLLTTSVYWEAVKKNSNNSLKDWGKQLLDTVAFGKFGDRVSFVFF